MAAINSSSAPQQYCLKWNSFTSNMSEMFQDMLMHENLVDCTLACDGLSIKAHKLILSACSPYFQQLFVGNPSKHPIIILKDVKFNDLKAIIDFIYSGEVNIPMEQLNSLVSAAETLKIKGLSDFNERQGNERSSNNNNNNMNNNNNNNNHFSPMHSTPLGKVLTMQNPASQISNNLTIPVNFNPFYQKGLKHRKRPRADITPHSLRNLNAFQTNFNSMNNTVTANPLNNNNNNNNNIINTNNNSSNRSSVLAAATAAKLNKQMLSSLVKAVPGVTGEKTRLEVQAAARLLENHFAKEQSKQQNGGVASSAAGSSDDEGSVAGESNNNRATFNGEEKEEEEFEPTKLLEQSMSTPENANIEYENEDDSDEEEDIKGVTNDDGFSSNNSNQDMSLMSTGSNGANPPQSNKSIQEYEQLLSEIQSKNLTTCPICAKEFIKKSKLIRHYHTHFSDFRPKFSCVFCNKLFTTQDWCKRHALNCQLKHYQGNGSNIGEVYGDYEMDSRERDI